MARFAKELAEEANAEWLPNFINYLKLKKIVHKYKDVRHSTRQVLMITVTTYGIIIHMPAQLTPHDQDKYVLGKDLRSLKEQLDVLTAKVDENHEIERDRMEKLTTTYDKLELDPDKIERQKARQARHDKMRQLFGSEELLEVEELPTTSGKMKVVAQMIARSSVCTRHFFKKLNKELSKVNKFFLKQEGRFFQRHLLLMKQTYLMKLQNKFTKRKLKTLKAAFKEHYKTLELLHRFRKLNHEGFKRIIKKYQKYTHNEIKKYYYDILNNQYFQASEVLDTMRHQSEHIAQEVLYPDKGRKNAMNKLKLPPSSVSRKQINNSFHTGFWLGAAALLTAVWITYYIVSYLPIEKQVDALRSSASLYFFRLLLFPIVLVFLIGIDVRMWNKVHINYVFIFELNPRRHISEMQLLRIPLVWYCIWSVFYIAFMLMTVTDHHSEIKPFGGLTWITVPVLYALMLLWMLNPLPIMYRSARVWLVDTVWRILLAPFYRVTFRDFWVADQLCSMSTFLFEMQFLLCISATSLQEAYGSETLAFCNSYVSAGVPVLNMWPYYARLMQCVRRFKDTRQIVHIVNGGKYLSSLATLLVYMFDTSFFPPDGPWSSIRTAWFIVHLGSTCYSLMWDLYMDWGLLRGFKKNESGVRAHYRLLRHELLFKHWIYYIAIAINMILRFAWVPLLFLRIYFPDVMSLVWISFITAAQELVRRGLWNIFRLENEHLTNVGQFRVTRDIPLPFEYSGDNNQSGNHSRTIAERFFTCLVQRFLFCFSFSVHKSSTFGIDFDSDEENRDEHAPDQDPAENRDTVKKFEDSDDDAASSASSKETPQPFVQSHDRGKESHDSMSIDSKQSSNLPRLTTTNDRNSGLGHGEYVEIMVHSPSDDLPQESSEEVVIDVPPQIEDDSYNIQEIEIDDSTADMQSIPGSISSPIHLPKKEDIDEETSSVLPIPNIYMTERQLDATLEELEEEVGQSDDEQEEIHEGEETMSMHYTEEG
uniref:SPX domain-containing protein n=1 Tax=Percolomonas cosmopolitus TaxID=63605 RepID=A0A7S1PG38_9EUKA|mmetsp:Transcript_4993/g.18762  ORF Transcript_4993/g.18762 Transcript_4993/m.18762 type:complete len:989 (+) Transcript_4993:464-3430(+)|eukprot:CAMPEP_0117442022 /NCGR_PEP_ID=MMETSP0759-20121206/3934_1 /TAXON_ID=63605 /ORGANISM="Percolomonas cosmopolitus, Strain WS" /LENGTH=988 /DNA_ID=CAMNT_0005233891 /DNA_START=398 /DNA_END=3364 /DNA_ORIENTATION=-